MTCLPKVRGDETKSRQVVSSASPAPLGGQITDLTLQLHLMANDGCGHQLGVGRMMSCGSSEVFVYILREK